MLFYVSLALILAPLFIINQNTYWKECGRINLNYKGLGVMLIAYFAFTLWANHLHEVKEQAFQPFVVGSLGESDIAEINPLDRWVAGAWNIDVMAYGKFLKSLAYYTIPCLLLFFVGSVRQRLVLVGLFYGGHYVTDSITRVVKGIVTRYRPFVYRSQEQIDVLNETSRQSFYDHISGYDILNSFYSGDTCTVGYGMVFFAILFQHGYPSSKYKGLVWIVAGLSIALGVYFRTLSGKHFATDTLFGAIVGAGMAWFIIKTHTVPTKITSN
jgi:hypothetical protein